MHSKVITLVRGLPGSGKSTVAKALSDTYSAKHFEADMYFLTAGGDYKFDGSKVQEAHKWCQKMVEWAVCAGYPVVVSNTFTQKWEMQFYIDLAEQYGYTVQVIECKGDFGNIHNVPENVISRMRERWESI